MRGLRGAVTAAVLALAYLSGGCEFPECGSQSDENNYPGGVCRQTASQLAAAGSSAPATTAPSPQQALIGFRARARYAGIVPAWLFTSNLGTFDIDALANRTTPSDQWRWANDGTTAVYEENGTAFEFQELVQLSAPPRDQRLDRLYELVDFDNSIQQLRFRNDGSLIVCDARGAKRHEHYAINGFAFDWTREDGSVERHAILYDPTDATQLWLGSRQLVASTAAACLP